MNDAKTTARKPAVLNIAFAVTCLLAALLAAAPAAAIEPAEILAQLRSTALDPQGAVSLRDVELEMGPGILDVSSGILFPATGSGHTLELVFIGQARFTLDAPDPIEAGQLELFTGEYSLDAPVEEAVIVLSNENAMAELLRRPQPRELRPEQIERATELHRRWLDGPERRNAGVEASIFKSLLGDALYQDYFAIWGRSFELGDFVYQLDPEDQEQITLASFEPLEMSNWERMRLRHHIRVQQRKGRWLDVRVQDLGSWDVWMSTSWSPSQNSSFPGRSGFETEHYELDVKLRKHTLQLEGRARLLLNTVTSGRRVVRLEMMRDMKATRITDDQGRELEFFRSADETIVLLPEPSEAGRQLTLDVSYTGRALEWVKGRTYDLQDTARWYPHCGTVDRATYDVTLRWPRRYDVVAGGSLVASGREHGYDWERRRLDMPSIAFSFAVGNFTVESRQVGHVKLNVALDRSTKVRITPELLDRTFETIAGALEYFEQAFGDYPLDELTVVTVPRQFSQSYLGFITLVDSLVTFPDPNTAEAIWTRRTTVAHELAHQWWGNLVGWWSYRDQWLSEGMANYSALLYESHASGTASNRLAVMSAGWRDSLSRTTLEGRTIESLGPIVLGNRLNSSRARNAYRTIVYRKGAVVLAMLARAVGEAEFIGMLHTLVEAASNKVMTTEDFVKSLERMSGLDLEGFAGQFIYGTGIPEVYYGYDLEPKGDGWAVQGQARLLSAPRYRYQIVQRDDGSWDLARHAGSHPQRGPTTLMVPYRVTLDPGASPTLQTGQLFLHGREDGFEIETERRPTDLMLDPRGEILAWFYSEAVHPKRVLRYHAEDLAAEGRLAEAEERYLEALGTPTLPDLPVDALTQVKEPRVGGPRENMKIRLELVRLYMEQGRTERAAAELDAIDSDLAEGEPRMFRMQRDGLRSRLDILAGNHAAAFRRLRKTLRLASPQRAHVAWRNLLWQIQLNAERAAVTEAYSLLAIAAHETNNPTEFEWALREARERGVDVTAFDPN